MPFASASRRQFLAAGAAGLVALRGGVAPAAEVPGFGRARSCILVYLLGGPPHQDMWDLKPDAPAEIRGEFRPIATSVPGLSISEHLPRLSRLAHRYSLVRSVTHPNHNHTHMIYYTLTGRHMTQPNPNDNVPNPPSRADHPHTGSVLARFRPPADGLPGYVALPELSIRMQPVTLQGGHAGFLGPRYDPFAVNEDPSQPEGLRSALRPEQIGVDRTQAREALLARIDGRSPASRPLREYETIREAAVRLTGSPRAARLFFLDDEPPHVRDRYGRHRFSQSLLLARRLAEAGIPMVAVHFNYMSKCDGWDTHSNNFTCLKDELLPLLDEGLSALLDDLDARGTLDETLVVCMGEFGRTPRINPNAGRDHWGSCASVLLAGGGVKPGRVIGSSDRFGAYPESDPHDPTEVQATIYHALGLRPDQPMIDPTGRPMPVCTARPLEAVMS